MTCLRSLFPLLAIVVAVLGNSTASAGGSPPGFDPSICHDAASCTGFTPPDLGGGADAAADVDVGGDNDPGEPSEPQPTPSPPTAPPTQVVVIPASGSGSTSETSSPATPGVVTTVAPPPEPPKPPEPPPPPPPPPDVCRNIPGSKEIPLGFIRDDEGACYPLPVLDLAALGPPNPISAMRGTTVTYVVEIRNGSDELATSVLFRDKLTPGLTPTSLRPSQGDRCVFDPDPNVREIICSVGTIERRQSASVEITIRVDASGTETVHLDCNQADSDQHNNAPAQTVAMIRPLTWGGHTFSSLLGFGRWLKHRGVSLPVWARIHPLMVPTLVYLRR